MGRIHAFQSLGTVDGPGVRFVVFFQGCPLHCGCCHNPDSRDPAGGTEISAEAVVEKVLRCRDYFGERGGITLSGGEPLMQAAFAAEIFRLCRKEGIHTCLDTSGCRLDGEAKALLSLTDRVLLDVKYANEEDYRRYVGTSLSGVLDFLSYLNEIALPTTLRRVIVPTLNDKESEILALKALADAHPCVDTVELLPFKKLCQTKYDGLGIPFPFAHLPTPDAARMTALESLLKGN